MILCLSLMSGSDENYSSNVLEKAIMPQMKIDNNICNFCTVVQEVKLPIFKGLYLFPEIKNRPIV